MKSRINSVLEEIVAEPASLQVPTREVLVGGPLSFQQRYFPCRK